ncbi:MAG: HNH endonuclease [Chlorogloeopsis fritschii C42_A2020_084]|jgi:putative restriction endonuclease|uniref:HNH endonuclease n=1 Tax=Chlorogloeopsis fritschii TaxID=1124 RepID=UPI0019F1C98F|nr:HNH endonuclease signature motif containing protein [Chlorogloeopsis fritschii]MBF2008260.1 HNH endonuclease [Chlorogloeopsis fritschii C42_A2020_084]
MSKFYFKENQLRAWSLLIIAEDEKQKYAGNNGYSDEVSRMYEYHSRVRYYDYLAPGDIALIRSKKQFLGIARIMKIDTKSGTKIQKLCPNCNKTKIDKRTTKEYIYRCGKCFYEFNEPIIKNVERQIYTAYYGDSFIDARGVISLEELKKFSLDKDSQLSIRPIDFHYIEKTLLKNKPAIAKLLNKNTIAGNPKANESQEHENYHNDNIFEYVPTEDDDRQIVLRQIKARRGQTEFRKALITRYGKQCMVSGCKLLKIVEAAHISPYRSPDDNHPENGLLLRTDLHTLFDLDLMGIHPESLIIKFHPDAIAAGYNIFEGRQIQCSKAKPSQKALLKKWDFFQKSLHSNTQI